MSSNDNQPTAVAATSLDITEHNLQQLKALFPAVFTEGKIDFDALRAELGEQVETANERYQFTWAGKEQAKRIATTPSLGTLRPAPDESVDFDSTENLYIEGDNLEVLKLLQKSYFNQVKMIYIDPPYNTGKDFVYKDDFRDNLANYQRLTGQRDEDGNPLFTNSDSAGRYHSNWLNMMYPRLKLARNLLRDDGVIFISIDDNEVHNLRKICDEIFGEANFVTQIVWQSKSGGGHDEKTIVTETEYFLVYAKIIDKVSFGRRFIKNDNYKLSDKHVAERGAYLLNKLDRMMRAEHYSQALNYPILAPDGTEIWPGNQEYQVGDWNWRWSRSKVNWGFENDFLEIKKSSTGRYAVYSKQYEKMDHNGAPIERLYPYRNVILSSEFNTTQGGSEILKIFVGNVFDYSKPEALISHILKISGIGNSDVVLDFFSGSATTAHAVMQLNAEDGGNRKFIMVQIPEPTPENSEARKAGYATIAEIGKERIRRAASKIQQEHPDAKADFGFKVLKLDTSNIKKWQPDFDNLEQDLLGAVDNILPGRSSHDLLYEVLIKYGLPLTLPVEQLQIHGHTLYNVANGSLVACFDEGITLETIQAIIALGSEEAPILRVVFRDGSFADDIVKTNAIQRFKQAGIEDVLSI